MQKFDPLFKLSYICPDILYLPANSTPSIGFLGFLSPNISRIGIQNNRGLLNPRILQSPVDTLVA